MEFAEPGKSGIWGAHTFTDELSREWRLGDLTLRCQWHETGLWASCEMAKRAAEDSAAVTATAEEDLLWRRWPLNVSRRALTLAPRMPDRPIVIRVENPFQLSPGVRIRAFVRIPVWVGLYAGKERRAPLIETPCVRLSNTWFGSFTEGDLCYWISSGARVRMEPDPARPYLAICPITMRNRDNAPLSVEKLCLRVSGLSLYRDELGQLWTDETVISYQGQQSGTRARVRPNPPAEASKAGRIADAREIQRVGLRAKTFAALRDLPGLGIGASKGD